MGAGNGIATEYKREGEGHHPVNAGQEPENRSGAEKGIDRVVPREQDGNLGRTQLLDKVAYGLGSVLMYAVQELQEHIATETRKVGDNLGQQLDVLQSSFHELTRLEAEQRAMILSMEQKYQQLAATTATLQESGARHESELSSLRTETREFAACASGRADALSKDLAVQQENLASVTSALSAATTSLADADARHEAALGALSNATQQQIDTLDSTLTATAASLRECDAQQSDALAALGTETKELAASVTDRIGALTREMGIQQDDIAALKSTVCSISSRADSIVERLDKQADTLRSMYATYAQRETELEQLVDGLARLRAYPAQAPKNGL